MPHRIAGPRGRSVRVAGCARIRNFVLVGHRRRDEGERVSTYENARNRNFNFGHVTCDALATFGIVLMVRVLCESRLARTIPRAGAVTIQAYFIGRLTKLRVIFCSVRIVTIKAGNAAAVHHALDEVIALHAVLVRRAVGKMSETQIAKPVVFELPIIPQVETNVKADGPVVVFSIDGICQRSALRVALNAGIVGVHVIKLGRI